MPEQKNGLKEFLHASPTPFQAVAQLKKILAAQGFTELSEAEQWKLREGAKHFVVRQGTSIAAFCLGDSPIEETGFRIVGAHTDSPCLRLKPLPELSDRHYVRLEVEIYGGVILSTWFDRDLSLAGRVYFSNKGGKNIGWADVDLKRPIAVIPNLAIHLNRSINENRTINRQTEMVPLAGHVSEARLNDALLEAVGKEADQIVSHDLYFYDTQGPEVVGLGLEFLASARLDNLLSCYAGARALGESKGKATRVLVCNDHEEVGSVSAQGAQGPFLKSVLERIAQTNENMSRAIAQSIFVSTDNAHGVHPSYPDKHDNNHLPILNKGPVIKTNTNQRYATSSETAAFLAACCQQADVPYQQFVARNDMPCGSTIGPITASVLGVRTVDVGVPTFAMHSIRELAGTKDADFLVRTLSQFFAQPGWK